jgi:dTDP-4-dehydrorhamnose reductase
MASSSSSRRVLVTGSTGLLGRAVLAEFAAAGWEAVGTSFSRGGPEVVKADLRDPAAVSGLVEQVRPQVVVHAAAERRPDVCEKDPAAAEAINIDAVFALGRACSRLDAHFIYISTDYLFDGTRAPYKEDAPTCPLNAYGRQKVRGEHAALASHPSPFILRVPVLYGPTTDFAESAVTTFAVAARASDRPQTIDDWQIRVPTYTPDIGRTLVNVANAMVSPAASTASGGAPSGSASGSGAPSAASLAGVFNYSAPERFTRYGLVQYFGKLLSVPTDHIARDPSPPKGAPRPYDCQLDTGKLNALGLAAQPTPFDVACRAIFGLPPA